MIYYWISECFAMTVIYFELEKGAITLYLFIHQSIFHKALIPMTPGGLMPTVVYGSAGSIIPPKHHPQSSFFQGRNLNQAGQRMDTQAGVGAEEVLLGHVGLTH